MPSHSLSPAASLPPVSGLAWPRWGLSNISSSPSPRGFSSFPLFLLVLDPWFVLLARRQRKQNPQLLQLHSKSREQDVLHCSFQFPFSFILSFFFFFPFAFASSSHVLRVATSYLSCKAVTQQRAYPQGLALCCGRAGLHQRFGGKPFKGILGGNKRVAKTNCGLLTSKHLLYLCNLL